jgi:sorting nexin-1/2
MLIVSHTEYLKMQFFLHSVSFQWEAKVERGQEEFDNISKMIKKEMERFEVNRVKDFKAIIMQYLENLMTHQQQVRDV